jgi:hypothetical protein
MGIHQAFLGHGVFAEFPDALLTRYAGWMPSASPPPAPSPSPPQNPLAAPGTAELIQALRYMNVHNVWIYAFGRGGMIEPNVTSSLVIALQKANFNLAAWGYCSAKNTADALKYADTIKTNYKIDAFIADVEPFNTAEDDWTNQDTVFDSLIDGLVQRFGNSNLGISVAPPWLMLDTKQDKRSLLTKHLIQRAANRISVLAPQVYWMDYPKNVVGLDFYGDTGFSPKDYPPDDPEAYARMCIQCWRNAGVNLPIVITGQAYWSASEKTPDCSYMEGQLAKFLSTFRLWTSKDFADRNTIGLNWYHAGLLGALEGSMSDPMISAIAKAQLDGRPYATDIV